jgi:DNA replication protein DnaC
MTVRPPSSASPGCPNRTWSISELASISRHEAEALAAAREQASQGRLEQAIGRSGIPRRFAGLGFAAYHAEGTEQRRAVAICRAYAGRFAETRAAGRSLLLTGNPGTGKTHLACAILAEILRGGHTGLFVTVSEALRLIRDAYSPRSIRTESEAFALLTGPDLLVLDEVGIAIGDATKRKAMLFDLLNSRYGDQRPTVLISNLDEAGIGEYLGERIMDRILEHGSALVPFTWGSYRRRGRVGTPHGEAG